MENQSVYDFIKTEEANFKASEIEIVDGLKFSFYETVRTATLYKNSELLTGKNDDKPVKNIILPLLRLQYRSEGFDVKDINIYVNDQENFYKSFLVRKYHEKWARENDLDSFIDDVVESYVDYGTALTKDVPGIKPDEVKLQSIAFCDQTDILSGPICIKHSYSPDQLREMASQGWDADNIETVIRLAGFYKSDQRGAKQNKTPGKYIEVYELHGVLPGWWLDSSEPDDESTEMPAEEQAEMDLVRQLQIVTFYQDKNDEKQGITLYAGKEKNNPFDVLLRDPIYGRALGLGGAEELFEAQVWTTYDNIRQKGLLDVAGKVIYQTTDAAFAARNKTTDLDNGEILVVADGKNIAQINTTPVNLSLFDRSVSEWYAHAQELAGASPFLLGEAATGGSNAFRAIAAIIQEGQALHDYRKGKIAVFFEKLYRIRFLKYFAQEIANGAKFLSELSLDELQQVVDSVITCRMNDWKKGKVLQGETWTELDAQEQEQTMRQSFMKSNQHFIEILKDEMKDLPLEVRISIASKQQDFAGMVQKLTSIVQMIIQAPQVLQDPVMAKLFNQILQYSGLDPLDFSGMKPPAQPKPTPQGQTPTPAAPKAAPANNLPVPQMVTATK